MTYSKPGRMALTSVILAGAAGVFLISPAASAQPYGGPYAPAPYPAGPTEEVTVTAPPFTQETTRLNGPLEAVSMSMTVPYGDLDLRTYHGARMLRMRVRDAARSVCTQLADAYPVHQLVHGAPCYRTAVDNGLVRADEAISSARVAYYYGGY